MPRRTTNIFERFQESFKAFTETSAEASKDANVLKSAYKSSPPSSSSVGGGDTGVLMGGNGSMEDSTVMDDVSSSEGVRRRRKTKKQVLEARSVDIEQVLRWMDGWMDGWVHVLVSYTTVASYHI